MTLKLFLFYLNRNIYFLITIDPLTNKVTSLEALGRLDKIIGRQLWSILPAHIFSLMNVWLISDLLCFYVFCGRASSFVFACVCVCVAFFYTLSLSRVVLPHAVQIGEGAAGVVSLSLRRAVLYESVHFLGRLSHSWKGSGFLALLCSSKASSSFLCLLLCRRLSVCGRGQISIRVNAGMCWWSDRWQRFVCSCWNVRGVYVQKAELQPNGGGRV